MDYAAFDSKTRHQRRTRDMENDEEKVKRGERISKLVFLACFFAGLGLSFALDMMPAGIFIGMAAGFGAMAAVRYKTGQW